MAVGDRDPGDSDADEVDNKDTKGARASCHFEQVCAGTIDGQAFVERYGSAGELDNPGDGKRNRVKCGGSGNRVAQCPGTAVVETRNRASDRVRFLSEKQSASNQAPQRQTPLHGAKLNKGHLMVKIILADRVPKFPPGNQLGIASAGIPRLAQPSES